MSTFNGSVIGGALNMRASCSTGSTRLTQIPNGTAIVVSIVSGYNEWFSTSYAGYNGYVMAQYVAVTSDGGTCTVSTTSGSLSVRVTPSSSATRLYYAAQYSTLRLLDYTSVSGWYRVSGSSGTGWAQSQYLTITSYPSGGEVTPPQPSDDAIPAPSVQITSTLRRNDNGSQVTALQKRLNQLCYYCGTPDQIFGETTEWAVKYFQQHNGLTADGVVGTNTRAKLNASGSNCGTNWGVDYSIRNWTQGNVPQQWMMNDTLWANAPFDASGTTNVETIGNSGNAPASFAMIVSTFNGTAITPPIVCKYVVDAGYRDAGGQIGILSGFFSAAATKYGLSYYGTISTISSVQSQLDSGRLVMARVVGSTSNDFCSDTGATYLVIYKIENNIVYVLNPNKNKQVGQNLSVSSWENGGWMRECHVYGR